MFWTVSYYTTLCLVPYGSRVVLNIRKRRSWLTMWCRVLWFFSHFQYNPLLSGAIFFFLCLFLTHMQETSAKIKQIETCLTLFMAFCIKRNINKCNLLMCGVLKCNPIDWFSNIYKKKKSENFTFAQTDTQSDE